MRQYCWIIGRQQMAVLSITHSVSYSGLRALDCHNESEQTAGYKSPTVAEPFCYRIDRDEV